MIFYVDNVLADPAAYRDAAGQQTFADVPIEDKVFRGIAEPPDLRLPNWISDRYPMLAPTMTFLRRSPLGQEEPNDVHTDAEMGDWTAILYLTQQPARGDGTTFWRHRESGRIADGPMSGAAGKDRSEWDPWHRVAARFNRLAIFPSVYFHSRSLNENYGHGAYARLIQVVFGRMAEELN